MGTIDNEKTQEYELEPGIHSLQCKYNWMSSPEKTFEISEEKNTYLQVSNGMKYFLPLYIILFIGILFPLFFKFSKLVLPKSTPVIKAILIFPALIYMITYLTIFRKKYLTISEDQHNPFK